MATTADVRGYPLYAAARPPSNQVAKLSTLLPGGGAPGGGATSFIKTVDGRDVSMLDSIFELLPGCHVVQTDTQLVLASTAVMWSGALPSVAFAFPMKAGHDYVVVVDLQEGMSGSGRIGLHGLEQDAAGKETANFPPMSPRMAAQACAAKATTPVPAATPPTPVIP